MSWSSFLSDWHTKYVFFRNARVNLCWYSCWFVLIYFLFYFFADRNELLYILYIWSYIKSPQINSYNFLQEIPFDCDMAGAVGWKQPIRVKALCEGLLLLCIIKIKANAKAFWTTYGTSFVVLEVVYEVTCGMTIPIKFVQRKKRIKLKRNVHLK